MEIRFQFDTDKAIQTMGYIVKRLDSVEKVKLMKLVYLADKAHFLRAGYPITGDRLCALPYGPVSSGTLDTLDGWPNDRVYDFLHVDDNRVLLRHDPGHDRLTQDEMKTLDEVLRQYGAAEVWRLVRQTHELPEYKEAYAMAEERGSKSAAISYDSILKHAGDEEHYRLGRPVVSAAMMSHMVCPFNVGEDADL